MKWLLRLSLILVSVISLSFNETSAQWYLIPQLKFTNIYCSLSLGDSTFLIGGDNGTLLRSTDNGTTWNSIMQNGIQVDTVLSLGEGLGYIFAGANGVEDVYRSSDNGDSWKVSNAGLPGYLLMNQFAFVDTMLYTATNAGVYGSADSGKTWKADTAGLNIGYVSPGLNNSTVGIASAGNFLYTINTFGGRVYRTSIDSIYWEVITNEYYNAGYAIASVDTNIFAANMKGIYLYMGDTTWVPRNYGLPVNDTTYIGGCKFTVTDSMLFAYILSSSTHSFSRDIFVTTDLGLTWKKVNDSVSSRYNISSLASNKKYLFAGTQMGGWRIPVTSLITSIKHENVQAPSSFYISQNYPNPFNPSTTIKYQLSAFSYVTLKVYNVLGKEVKILVDGYKERGNYTVNFDAGNLASGVYFYQMKAGNFTSTKKLLLLK